MQFRSLAKRKGWRADQLSVQLLTLIDGDLLREVERIASDASSKGLTFEDFYREVGLLLVPADYCEDLDEELWTLTKRREETVQRCAARLRQLTQMYAELPQDSQTISELQQCRYFRRAMPPHWQDKLACCGISYETVNELAMYFERLERRERQTGRDRLNGPATQGGEKGQGRRDQQRPTADQRRDRRNPREHCDTRQDHRDRPGVQGGKKKHDRHQEHGKWCSFHKSSLHDSSECFALKKQREEHKPAETKRTAHKKSNYPRFEEEEASDSDSDSELKLVGLVKKKQPSAKLAPLRIPVQFKDASGTFNALLDSGASRSIINQETMRANAQLGHRQVESATKFQTVNGEVASAGSTIVQFRFPSLQPSTIITHKFEILDQSQDAMVIGRDILNELGIVLNFKDKLVQWDGHDTHLNTGGSSSPNASDYEFPEESKEVDNTAVRPEDLMPDRLSKPLVGKYLQLLRDNEHLYDGHLGRMRFEDYALPIVPEYKPVHAKPYPVPRSLENKARELIQHLVSIDVLEQIFDSEMASPAFFLKKPNGSLRLLIDFRGLNRYLKRSPYYVPRIREILLRLAGAKYLSTFDANMGYYARRLAASSRGHTAFCLPFGKYQYKRLPMGISTAPDEYQACMEKIFGDLAFVVVYLDDILVYSDSEETHLEHLHIVFKRLTKYGVTLNGKKCHILRQSVDYLGFTLTSQGIQPQQKKIQAIQQISVPKTRKELRRFLGMINYYRDMVPNKTALCQPLNRFTSSKVPFDWLSSDTEAFHAIQKAFAQAVLLAFPDFEQPFHVYADASGKQIGGIIMQKNQILACYSRSLNKHQVNYTTMELELLSIVEMLREYRTMLLGFPVVVHTDHKNLIYPTETSLRVKRWKLLLAEYRLSMHYIKGTKNVGADAFSRMRFDAMNTKTHLQLADEICATADEPDCVMHGPVLCEHQDKDLMIQKIKTACLNGNNNPDYQLLPILGCTLVAYQKRVIVPDSLREDLIRWYHLTLSHPGGERQYKTMRQVLYWPGMEAAIIKNAKDCLICKKAKVHGGKQDYGLLPPRTLKTVNPFDTVHVDLIGPYEDGHYGITMIDHATRWLEVGIQHDKTSLTTAESFDREWLCRYPRPVTVIHDLGTEFTGDEFQELLRSYGIQAKPITSKNPQANAICERVHLEILNVIRCHDGTDWKKTIHYAAFAVRASYHSILNASPGQLLFGQDMITRQLYNANWSYLSKRRFDAILADNDRENSKRLEHFYNTGDHVMLRVPKKFRAKLHAVATGPFVIRQVHSNGTVTIDKGAMAERVSIRRIFPC
uniref:RNA-directed DNA polymerase n=1 Tax=Peronospora matthiolae TaxID=2874970 RepID=A0AAV1U4K5_9STRA